METTDRTTTDRSDRLRTLFDTSPDAIVLHDIEGDILDANEQASENLGYGRDDLLSMAVTDIEVGVGREELETVWENLDEGERTRVAGRHQRADGSTYPVEVTIRKIDLNGDERFLALCRDVTDRREYQRELKQNEAKYRNLFEESRDALMLLNRDGFIDCNEATLELFGFDCVETFFDYGPWGLSPPTQPNGRESKSTAKDKIEQAFEEGSADFEWRHRRADGTDFEASVKLSRIELDDEPALHAIVRDISEQKQFEQQLIKERDFLDNVIESLPYPFYVLNVNDYTVDYVNSQADIRPGETCYEVTHQRERPCDEGDDPLSCPLAEVVETGESTSVEHVHSDDDGQDAVFEVHAAPIFDEDGNVTKIAESNINVTQRVEHEQRLAALHEGTRRLIDANSVNDVCEIIVNAAHDLLDFTLPAIWTPDKDSQEMKLTANTEEHQQMLDEAGIDAPTFGQDHWTWEIFQEDETLARNPIPSEDLAADVPLQSAIAVSLGNHGIITFSTRGEVDFSDREIALAETLAKNAQIVLDELEQQEELKRQQQFTNDLLDAINDVVYVLDTDGDFLDWNQAFEEVTGYGGDELASMNATDLFAEEDHEAVTAAVEESFETGQTRVELDFLTANDESIPYEFVASSFENPVGDLVLAGIGRDRSQHVEYELRLEAQRNNLEILNQVVRHDIRNDMTVVRGRARMLDEYVDDAGRAHLEAVLRGAESAMDLTTTARDLAATMLSTDADVEPVELDSHVERAVEDTRSQFPDAVITADRIPEAKVPGNEFLQAVFRNLLTNGVIHNDKAVPEVLISTYIEDDKVTVSVADNGPGIPDNQKETIFGKGEKRLDSPGTGVGLYLVQTLVDQYGGDVWVEDNDPEGSVFYVELPLAEPKDDQ